MNARSFYVYILASRVGGMLYIGVTNDLIRRVAQHKSKLIESFTENTTLLGWYTSNSLTIPRTRAGGRSD
jgi:predicted GIY-YIG superfamily endonuclease